MRVNLPSNSLLYNKLYNKRNFTFSQNPVNKEEENKAQAAHTTAKNNIKTIAKNGVKTGQKAAKEVFSTAATIPSAVTSTLWLNRYRRLFTQDAETVYKKAVELAKKYKSPTIEVSHLWLAILIEANKFLEKINKGEEEFYIEGGIPNQLTIDVIMKIVSKNFPPDINEEKIRKKVKEVIKKYIEIAQDDFEKEAKTRTTSSIPVPSRNAMREIDTIYGDMAQKNNSNAFFDEYFLFVTANTKDKKTETYFRGFNYDLKKAIMIDEPEEESKFHLGFYDEKADSLWKTVDMGKSVLVLRDYNNNQSSSSYLINSFENLIKKPGNSYRNLNKDNIEIIRLNEYADFDFVAKLIKEKTKENEKTGKTTIITGDFERLSLASLKFQNGGDEYTFNDNEADALANISSDDEKKSKVRIVFAMDSSIYHKYTGNNAPASIIFNNYAPLSLPEMTSKEAKQYLTDKKGMEYINNKIGKPVDKKAIERAIELTKDDEGSYPDKTLDLLNKVSNSFIASDSVTEEQVIEYSKQIQELTETRTRENETAIVYNTGKTLADIVGSQMTKDAAQSVVDEIKNNPQTKGYLIYQSDYTSDGGGRTHTAEAIAGELGIPMITINAKEFLLKDIGSLQSDPNFPELKIKTMVAKAKAQAKTNPYNTAMIFIENFDDFATDQYKGYPVETYAQKAFSQLLTEMKTVQKEKDVNLIVMGSVNYPQVISDNIRKPYKFMDEIVIYPPQDKYEREDLIKYYIKNLNLNISGDEDEQKEIIKHAALTTDGLKVVDIIYMLKTAQSVSRERGKTAIDKADMTEAFMRTMYGRVNKYQISDHRKKIFTSHEAGHALTLQIMYNIAQKQKDTPWKLPGQVNFITLDPRGYYGGAMYYTNSGKENCFETIMADIACDYGGHASEKAIYGYTGSWGISADMEAARCLAESAVVDMGMGVKTGVRNIPRDIFGGISGSASQLENVEDDEELILSTAEEIADNIVSEYKEFIEEFTENHWRKVGTGECIITAEEFNAELNDWIARQDKDKKESLEKLEKKIVKKMERAKHGKEAKKK